MHRIELTAAPIDINSALSDIYADDAGGVCVFLGTTRAEAAPGGEPLEALHYEAYEALAIKQFQALVDEAQQRWPMRKCVLLHRTGRVAVGQASVLIAVATPHRADAFDACRWLIDSLKAVASIWKKELWAGGDTSWVAGTLPPSPGAAPPAE